MRKKSAVSGRVALVTGGSRGLGAGIARRLANEGATVAVNYNHSADAANEVVDDINSRGGHAAAFRASIDSFAAVDSMIGEIRSSLGPIDIVVSNAGTASKGRSVVDTEMVEFEKLMRVHALGPLHLLSRVIPDMRRQERSSIVAVSSATVVDAPSNSAPYTMAKAALEMAMRTLAREERRHGIRVNIVAPGLIDTEMGARLVRAISAGGHIDDLHKQSPFGRVCSVDDVAGLVAFLVSEEGGYITGQRLTVDGGGKDPAIL